MYTAKFNIYYYYLPLPKEIKDRWLLYNDLRARSARDQFLLSTVLWLYGMEEIPNNFALGIATRRTVFVPGIRHCRPQEYLVLFTRETAVLPKSRFSTLTCTGLDYKIPLPWILSLPCAVHIDLLRTIKKSINSQLT